MRVRFMATITSEATHGRRREHHEPDDTTDALTYTFTVGPGQVGGHILWAWKPPYPTHEANNVDVINVWDITGNTYTSIDWDQDYYGGSYDYPVGNVYPGPYVRGASMIEGPFMGFAANFNFAIIPEPTSMALVGSSLVGLAGLSRRKKR
jgi:hypothetical protein